MTVASVASNHIHKWLHSTGCVDGNVENWLQIISDMKYTDKNSSFGSNLKHLLPFVGCPYFMNDLLVDLPSQLGYEKHSNVKADYDFITYKRKFKEKDYKKRARKVSDTSMPAIVHNLEARDTKLIDYIKKNITMGTGKNEWLYEVQTDGTATVNGYTGRMAENGVLTVPDSLDGHTVRTIGDSAFEEISARETITEVYLPNTLTSIGERAFAECDTIRTVYFEPYVDNSEYNTIGEECFAGCTQLTEVRMSDTVRQIEDYAFNGCTSLASITLGGRLTDVRRGIFLGCTQLAAIDVDAGNAQYKAENGVLLSRDGTRLIEYPEAKTNSSYTVPDSVRVIGADAFYGNTHLQTVDLNQTERVEKAAFYDCSALSRIAGNAVEFVAHGAFEGTAWLDGSENEDAEKLYAVGKTLVRYGGNKTETEISTYETIAPYAFAGNTTLNDVTLSGNVLRSVGESAFADCLSLSRVTITNRTQAVSGSDDMFANAADGLKIYVPNAMIAQYSAENGWADYASAIQPATVTVTFDTCGGASIEPVSVNYGERYDLPTPQKQGCVFIGWYDNIDYAGGKIAYVTPETLQDITLYARWANETYTVTFDTQIGDWGQEHYVVRYGETFTLPPLQCDGAIFRGWMYNAEKLTSQEGRSYGAYTFTQNIRVTPILDMQYIDFELEGLGETKRWKLDFAVDDRWKGYTPNGLLQQLQKRLTDNDKTIFDTYIYREGHVFCQVTTDREGNYIADKQTETMVDAEGKIKLYLQYRKEQYAVNFVLSDDNTKTVMYAFGDKIAYPDKNGYDTIWYNGQTEFLYATMPDLSPKEENSAVGYVTIHRSETPLQYSLQYKVLETTFDSSSEAVNMSRISLQNAQATYYTGDRVALPDFISKYYTLSGWYTENCSCSDKNCVHKAEGVAAGEYGDHTFYAKVVPTIYTVSFATNGGSACTPISVKYGSTIILPSTTIGGYDGTWQYWGYLTGDRRKSNFGCAYTVTKNSTMTVAWWEKFSITYANLQYQGKTAKLRNTAGEGVPKYYHFFSSDSHLPAVDLNNVVAEMTYGTTVFRFLGWYKEATFKTPVSCIGEWESGNVTLYAKWRCDYSLFSRKEPYRITDSNHKGQKHDIIYYGYKFNPSALSDLRILGMKHLVLDIRIEMWDIDSGYQRLWLYADDSVLLWKTQFEYGGSGKDTTPGVVRYTVVLDLDTLANFDSLYLRYSATGKGDDDWQNNRLTIERMAVVETKDVDYLTYYDRDKNFLVGVQ